VRQFVNAFPRGNAAGKKQQAKKVQICERELKDPEEKPTQSR
jgi:hypothetical protein